MNWEINTQEKFKSMISKIPVFHRRITEEATLKRAKENALMRQASQIQDEDVISAFFSDVPSPFYSMMIRLMEQTGFDYQKYGFPRNSNHKVKK